MRKRDLTRVVYVTLALACALVTALLTGCGSSKGDVVEAGQTARDNLGAARSALATSAPDARLLELYLAEAATPTSKLGWVFVFGSPGTDKIYFVHTSEGKLLTSQEAGEAGLSADEWADVPGTDAWKIDSDEAYSKALEASGAKGTPDSYMMGMMTYRFSTDTSTVEPFVWRVRFTPGASGATTSAIDVDATTGKATVTNY